MFCDWQQFGNPWFKPTLTTELQESTTKIYKADIPICPAINYTKVPTYKVAGFLTQTLNVYLNLDNQYVVSNSINLAHYFTKIKINDDLGFTTYDIKDLSVNIPIQEVLNMTDNLLQLSATDPLSKSQILHLLKTVLSQNYTFSGSIHIPTTKWFSNGLTSFKHNR
jgi:hypothetical protein